VRRQHSQRLIFDCILLGVVGALAARVFVWLLGWAERLFLVQLAGYQPPGLASDGPLARGISGPHGLWFVPLATTLGGLLAGLLVYRFAPEAEGHGTDTVVAAFHRAGGAIRARVPLVKLVASAITIGSGGAAGREGPIALITAGVGSVYGRWTRRPEEEIRLLVLAGMAAGLAAIFRSPVGTAIFAIEVLYSEMDFEGIALFYTMLSSIVAYAVTGLFVGLRPLFVFPAGLTPPAITDYGWYLVLGVASGIVGTAMPMVLYTLRDAFRGLHIPQTLRPAIGGLCVGLLALVLPQVLAGGYGWIQQAIDGQLPARLLLVLALGKMVAFGLTIGSGGSGGVFAPSLYVGAMLGGFLASVTGQPHAAFAVVGMAAVFAGAARVPIATLLMVTGMTSDYSLFVPGALAVMASFFVQGALSRRLKYSSLYEAQTATRADSPAHAPEHVQLALRLLASGVQVPPEAGTLELTAMLAAGLPVTTPDGRQMRLAVLRPESPCVGKPVGGGCLGADIRMLLAFRGRELLWPHDRPALSPGDRLLIVTSPAAWARALERDLRSESRPAQA
jgi:chloride channel protein, CIC family